MGMGVCSICGDDQDFRRCFCPISIQCDGKCGVCYHFDSPLHSPCVLTIFIVLCLKSAPTILIVSDCTAAVYLVNLSDSNAFVVYVQIVHRSPCKCYAPKTAGGCWSQAQNGVEWHKCFQPESTGCSKGRQHDKWWYRHGMVIIDNWRVTCRTEGLVRADSSQWKELKKLIKSQLGQG